MILFTVTESYYVYLDFKESHAVQVSTTRWVHKVLLVELGMGGEILKHVMPSC